MHRTRALARNLGMSLFSSLIVATVLLAATTAQGQATSRLIPFRLLADPSYPPGTVGSVDLQLWDAPIGATPQVDERQTVTIDADGTFGFVFGSNTVGGLDPNNFPSGSDRWLDV